MSSTPKTPQTRLIDFTGTAIERYYGHPNHYALIIDNCFTPAECAELSSLAESHPGEWKDAMIKKGEDRQEVEKDVRDCARILRDDPETAEMIFQRVKPFLESVWQIGDAGTGVISGTWRNKVWRMSRLNERLRFLKYGEGQFFQVHCDGPFSPSATQRSFLTLHLYLNDSVADNASEDALADGSLCKGGATRFWGQNMKDFLDVEAKIGRVLVFQHRNLLHSGEPVTGGIKKTLRSDIIYEAVENSPKQPSLTV